MERDRSERGWAGLADRCWGGLEDGGWKRRVRCGTAGRSFVLAGLWRDPTDEWGCMAFSLGWLGWRYIDLDMQDACVI